MSEQLMRMIKKKIQFHQASIEKIKKNSNQLLKSNKCNTSIQIIGQLWRAINLGNLKVVIRMQNNKFIWPFKLTKIIKEDFLFLFELHKQRLSFSKDLEKEKSQTKPQTLWIEKIISNYLLQHHYKQKMAPIGNN